MTNVQQILGHDTEDQEDRHDGRRENQQIHSTHHPGEHRTKAPWGQYLPKRKGLEEGEELDGTWPL